MARAPVNSLNIELLGALKASLLESKENRSTGIILTSSLPSIFSAGLDIVEIYNSDAKGLSNFWHAVQDTWLTLYSLEIPVAAAIQVLILSRAMLLCICACHIFMCNVIKILFICIYL
jgi:3,2-trans-enoyl-CoA isomerase